MGVGGALPCATHVKQLTWQAERPLYSLMLQMPYFIVVGPTSIPPGHLTSSMGDAAAGAMNGSSRPLSRRFRGKELGAARAAALAMLPALSSSSVARRQVTLTPVSAVADSGAPAEVRAHQGAHPDFPPRTGKPAAQSPPHTKNTQKGPVREGNLKLFPEAGCFRALWCCLLTRSPAGSDAVLHPVRPMICSGRPHPPSGAAPQGMPPMLVPLAVAAAIGPCDPRRLSPGRTCSRFPAVRALRPDHAPDP